MLAHAETIMQKLVAVIGEIVPPLAGVLAQTQIDNAERAVGQIIVTRQRVNNALAPALRLPTLQRADL